jgi:hypothetical protein
MGATLSICGKAIFIFFSNCQRKFSQPHIIGEVCPNPDSTRMMKMNWAKSWLIGTLTLRSAFHMFWYIKKLLGGCDFDRGSV